MAATCPKNRLIILMLLSAFYTTAGAKTIYVDDDAAGANNGSSWRDAYIFLQEALADARTAAKPVEIRVAQGIYRPNGGLVAIPEFDWRTTTFQLINGVTLKGGYAGSGTPDPNARDVEAFATILSGDLNGDDVVVSDPGDLAAEPSRTENSYHVVTGNWTDETAVLDGFVIIGGNADGPQTYTEYPDKLRFRRGGGMYNYEGSPILTNCTFSGNSAFQGSGLDNWSQSSPTLSNCAFLGNCAVEDGGGMNNGQSSPILSRCTFSDNSAAYYGGGMNNYQSSPILTDCTFSRNSASVGGGMVNSTDSDPILTGCTFSGNSAEDGGGMFNWRSSPTLTDCTFSRNSAMDEAGGMYNYEGSPTLTDCAFSGNSAEHYYGGAVYNDQSSPTLTNCTFSGNSAHRMGGGMISEHSNLTLTNCTFARNWAQNGNALGCDSPDGGACSTEDCYSNVALVNCILWNGGDEIWNNDRSTITVTYSNIQGGFLGEGNIDLDPFFAKLGYWTDANDPNTVVEPNDPNAVWVDGDYHLKSQAGRWDPVSGSWVVDDVTSPCIDAGDPNNPVGDEPEPNGGRINMGAYGGTSQASLSYAEQIVTVQWLGHSTVKIWTEGFIVYVDPERVPEALHDADLVCVTHTHGDHYSPSDIANVSNAQTQFIGPPDVVQRYGSGQAIAPGQTIDLDGVSVVAVPAYNTNKPNHPRSNNWVGYIIELGGRRVYVAGDTDLIEEMKSLGAIDVAFLPAGGTYTMNAVEAAEATQYVRPGLAIPYHWGQSVGTLADAQRFVELARSPAMVLAVNESVSSGNWPEYLPLVAHWRLDESEGEIAHDNTGDNDGTVYGGIWQPAGGKTGGAIELDGLDDYVGAGPVLNPGNGPFSVFAWVKGGVPAQVVISQTGATGQTWLGAEPLSGTLVTGLVPPPAGRLITQPLVSEFAVTDGIWHHVGLTWDGSVRRLFVDGVEVAADAGPVAPPQSSDGGLNIGAGGNPAQGTFWAGLIDDVRVYNLALSVEEIGELAR